MKIPDEHLITVCKYRQGPTACRYIFYMLAEQSFVCGKKIPDVKDKIDAALDMSAEGDNCMGLE
jgi:hypothetical protein